MNSTARQAQSLPLNNWYTNRQTGKKYRPDGDGYVSARRQKNLPARFRDNRRRERAKANKLLAEGSPGARLVERCGTYGVWFYTLDANDLGLDPSLERPECLYDQGAVECWVRALAREFGKAPYFWRLEVGREGRVHLHVLSSRNAGCHHIVRGSLKCQRAKPGELAKVLRYMLKAEPPTQENVRAYEKAVKRAGGEQYLPQTSGFRNCRKPRPKSFKFRADASTGFKPLQKVRIVCVRDGTSTKDTPKTNSTVQRKKIAAELPVILRGSTPFEAEVTSLFDLWRHRRLRGVLLDLPDGTMTSCLENTLGTYFNKWLLLGSECAVLAQVLNNLQDTLQGQPTASWIHKSNEGVSTNQTD